MSQSPIVTGTIRHQHNQDAGVKATSRTKTRSRNGCPQCKAKRLKCDETKPQCLMCLKNNRKCPGYSQSFRWSTKHEKTLSGKSKGPSNLTDLFAVTTRTIPNDEAPLNGTSPPQNDHANQLDTSCAQAASDGCPGNDRSVDWTNISLPPVADDLMPVGFDYGIEDLLQDIWREDPQLDTQPPIGQFNGDCSLPEQSLSLSAMSPGRFGQTPLTAWGYDKPFSPPHQPIFSEIPRLLNDQSSLLVEEWFRHVCSMWSSFDSDANMNRKLAYETWTRSETVMNCLQGMSAICLSVQLPHLRRVATAYLKTAISSIQKDVELYQSRSLSSFPTDLLLSLCCVGTAACWIDTKEIGGHFLREAKTILKRLNLNADALSAQDRQILSFFNNSLIYWNMLVAVVSDEKDDLGIPKLKEPDNKALTGPIVPHPWTGINSTPQRLFTQAVKLCRRFRRHLRQGSISTRRNLETALRDIKEAQDIEEELLSLEQLKPHEIADTGDKMSTKAHLIDVAEGYRLSSLLQLYQTFPDLVARRLPDAATESPGFVPWDDWIVPLSLRLVKTLRRIPVSSGTRCIQPLLYLLASTGLRFDAVTLLQHQTTQNLTDFSPRPNSSGSMGTDKEESQFAIESEAMPEPQVNITKLSIEVTHARRFIMERLSALEHSLPPAPVVVAKKLVQAIWAAYDSERSGMNFTHWVDVMEDSDLRTIFG